MKETELKLLDYLRTHDRSPTVGEMKKAIGTKSSNILYKVLDSLEEQGFIKRHRGKWRGVELLPDDNQDNSGIDWIRIPLLGFVAAGHPIEAIFNPETITVPTEMLKKGANHFALKVRGNSMIDEHIIHGDQIILREASTAENGDIVVALVDGEDATIKSFKNMGRFIHLEPANDEFETIIVESDRVTIQGIFVGMIRVR